MPTLLIIQSDKKILESVNGINNISDIARVTGITYYYVRLRLKVMYQLGLIDIFVLKGKSVPMLTVIGLSILEKVKDINDLLVKIK